MTKLLTLTLACLALASSASAQLVPLKPCEARTPIDALPYSITESGSYYLTRNLKGVAGSAGITVTAKSATIDLNGFTMKGVAGSLDAIEVPGALDVRLRVKNGTIDGWGGMGIDLTLSTAKGSKIESVRITNSGSTGLRAPEQTMVFDCVVSGNGSQGIQVGGGSLIDGCVADGNTFTGIVFTGTGGIVRGCSVRANGSDGIGQTSGSAWIVSHNVSTENARDGISVTTAALVRENNCADNLDAGIALRNGRSYTIGNLVANNAIGIEAQVFNHEVVVRNTANGNGSNFLGAGGTNDFGTFGTAAGSTIHWNNISH